MALFGETFNEQAFRQRLDRSADVVSKILDATRHPKYADDVHHQYSDKYLLAEFVTNCAAASQINCLLAIGLSSEQIKTLHSWAKTQTVSLKFQAEERCSFLREETKDVEGTTKVVEEVKVAGQTAFETTSKVVRTVTKYSWRFTGSYELTAVRGTGASADDKLRIASHEGSCELTTNKRVTPYPEVKVPAKVAEINITWLLRNLKDDAATACFSINRQHAKCHTPRRNQDVESALSHFRNFASWAGDLVSYMSELDAKQQKGRELSSASPELIFVPVLPLLEEQQPPEAEEAPALGQRQRSDLIDLASEDVEASAIEPATTSVVLGLADANRFLEEERRCIKDKFASLGQVFPSRDSLITAAAACFVVSLRHCLEVCQQLYGGLNFIECMLRKQLIAAIGKEVSPADFAEYMRFHFRKLFADAFAPKPFCFAVRRSEQHGPEGTVSIEEGGGGSSGPVVTMVARSDQAMTMQFALNASTSVSFTGHHCLHALLSHRFAGESGSKLSLVSRARQFSSMIVLVGRVVSASTFDPQHAFIVQNRDELTIPLVLSTIPTPQEFKDAIESLSPEQQRFAKAFRSMQLESTLFGIVIIQIKPQLEKVLNLPEDSLTKEIRLTQDLMQLFIKYQIPSDLLSFSGASDATAEQQLDAVKGHVQAMKTMLDESKAEEIEGRRREELFEDPFASTGTSRGAFFGGCSNTSAPTPESDCFMASDFMMGSAMPMMACCGGGGGGFGAPPPAAGFGAAQPQARGLFGAAAPASAPAFGAGFGAPQPQAQSRGLFGAAAQPTASAGGGLFGGGAQPQQQQQSASVSGFGVASSTSASAVAGAGGQFGAQPQRQEVPSQKYEGADGADDELVRDYTKVPVELDRRFEELDEDGALRPAIIKLSDSWTKSSQKALLAKAETSTLGKDEQKTEKDAAFDLLDALTKSGALAVEHASLHVVVAASHCFDKTVIETVVQGNLNPIEKVERSALIMASTIHRQPVARLLNESQQGRVSTASPALFVCDDCSS
eukprot:gb/GFBE01056310.1/.p1 GENE.gb/GFBE01056310.1/~~gb/GFBE01056310.1/.p1  ORF type:complete len:1013 (+),score=257.29 gb/GFBE01056310.1/:1-3039(+)